MGFDGRHALLRESASVRRAAVLSYEETVAGAQPVLRRSSRTLAVMPAPDREDFGMHRDRLHEELARDPLAHPVAPARPQRAAKPVYEVITEELYEERRESVAPAAPAAPAASVAKHDFGTVQELKAMVVEPVESSAEPRHRGSLHGGVENPVRSMLSPSQRAAQRRPETKLDRNGRPSYVTYTVDTSRK
jgi:hypothetical protein